MGLKQYLQNKKESIDNFAERQNQKIIYQRKQQEFNEKLEAKSAREELKLLKSRQKDKDDIKKLKDFKQNKHKPLRNYSKQPKSGVPKPSDMLSGGDDDYGLGSMFNQPKRKKNNRFGI